MLLHGSPSEEPPLHRLSDWHTLYTNVADELVDVCDSSDVSTMFVHVLDVELLAQN